MANALASGCEGGRGGLIDPGGADLGGVLGGVALGGADDLGGVAGGLGGTRGGAVLGC
ncbi:MAG TPA: hypothetical protein VGJ15_04910 [Pirellulales bacterium]